MYFTEDYASDAKLVELQASEEQAEEAYAGNPSEQIVSPQSLFKSTLLKEVRYTE